MNKNHVNLEAVHTHTRIPSSEKRCQPMIPGNYRTRKNETILYEDQNGTQDEITLSDNINNYRKIKIEYGISWVKKSVELDLDVSKIVSLEMIVGGSNGNLFQIYAGMINFSVNSANFIADRNYTVIFNSSGMSSFNTNNNLYIYKITGIK